MKTLGLVLLAVLSAGALGLFMESNAEDTGRAPESEPVPVVLSGDTPEGRRVVTLGVEGMRCGACAHEVYTALRRLPDVSDAAVDVVAGRAQAVVPAAMDVGQVAASVEVAGLVLVPLE